MMWVCIKDSVDYPFNEKEISEEEAIESAREWWIEREPEISVVYEEGDDE